MNSDMQLNIKLLQQSLGDWESQRKRETNGRNDAQRKKRKTLAICKVELTKSGELPAVLLFQTRQRASIRTQTCWPIIGSGCALLFLASINFGVGIISPPAAMSSSCKLPTALRAALSRNRTCLFAITAADQLDCTRRTCQMIAGSRVLHPQCRQPSGKKEKINFLVQLSTLRAN